MVKVDLITGFLGSGKTTFIRKYTDYLRRAGQKFMIIENEFGSLRVDSTLLEDTGSEVIRDLAGACMCCTGFEKFRLMLLEGAKSGCDRILVEPSGIYDVDEFFNMMSIESVRECCEIGSIITIEAPDVYADTDETSYLMFSQLLAAGHVLISKAQLFPADAVEGTINRLNRTLTDRGEAALPPERLTLKNWMI